MLLWYSLSRLIMWMWIMGFVSIVVMGDLLVMTGQHYGAGSHLFCELYYAARYRRLDFLAMRLYPSLFL